MSVKNIRIILFAALYAFFSGGSASAQESLKSPEEDYYDFLAVQGLAERPHLNYRTLSDSVWKLDEGAETPWSNARLESRFGGLRIYGPSAFISYNTEAPYGQNDGALWQGRGFNIAVNSGLRFEKYGFELTLKPRLTFSQNLPFDIMPPSNKYQSDKYKGKAADYGYYGGKNIDLPQRFGEEPFFTFDWGDSDIRYTWKTLTIGFGTQAIWLGPSYLNAILHSNNAPPYPKIDLGIRKQSVSIPFLGWNIGEIEARLWIGRLSESDYFDNNPSNDHSMFHGLSIAYSPSFLPGLILFADRTCRVPWGVDSLKYIIPTGESKNVEEDDQRASFGADWTFPKVGFELYTEIGIDDFVPGGVLGLIRYPFHTWVYTIGVKKTVPVSPNHGVYGEILLEWTNMEVSQDYQFQWASSFYFHGGLNQGHTNQGQLMGAGSGWGGNSQFLAFKLYYARGTSTAFIHRNNPDNDFIYGQAVGKENTENANGDTPEDIYFTGFKSNLTIGVNTLYFLSKNLSIGGGAAYNLIINPFFFYANPSGDFKFWKDVYTHNFSFFLTAQWTW
jgi:hypothetical protein